MARLNKAFFSAVKCDTASVKINRFSPLGNQWIEFSYPDTVLPQTRDDEFLGRIDAAFKSYGISHFNGPLVWFGYHGSQACPGILPYENSLLVIIYPQGISITCRPNTAPLRNSGLVIVNPDKPYEMLKQEDITMSSAITGNPTQFLYDRLPLRLFLKEGGHNLRAILCHPEWKPRCAGNATGIISKSRP